LGSNILDSHAANRLGWPKPKRKKTPVTLIIGIICKDAIVLAADSQTTKGISKQPGTNKISVVKFSNGKALVAESGSASLSNRAIQIFQTKAEGVKMENELSVAKIAEEAVREIRNSLTSLHPGNTSPTDWQDFFGQEINYFELMVAYYFGDKPCLYKLNPLWCIPVPTTSYFMTSGIAGDLANYILKEHTEPKMDSEFASVIAIKVVEDAIEYVEGCGSPPRVALIKEPLEIPEMPKFGQPVTAADALMPPRFHYTDPVVVFPEKKVQEIAKIIASVEQQTKNAQNKKIHQALRSQTEKAFKEMMKDVLPSRYRGLLKKGAPPKTMLSKLS
jgi:20S proteasome alpha/beta subunit